MKAGFALAAFVLLALGGCRGEEPVAEAPVRPVKSLVVQAFGAQPTVFTGLVQPQVSTDYSFQTLGRMVQRPVDVGDTVEAGTLLASLDASVQEQSVQAAEASLAGARATLSNASGVEARQQALLASNVATQADLDSARQALQSARSAATQAEASLAREREQLEFTRLTAGNDGVVTAVDAEAGQVVSPGQTVVTVARPELRDAVIDLPDPYAASLTLGSPVEVRLELAPDIVADGRVREIAPIADPVTRARRVRIALQNPPTAFRLGSIARVALPGGAPEELAVPESAILTREGQTYVWVIPDAGGAASLREVGLGDARGGRVALREGVSAGERIAAAGVNTLAEGKEVSIEGAVR